MSNRGKTSKVHESYQVTLRTHMQSGEEVRLITMSRIFDQLNRTNQSSINELKRKVIGPLIEIQTLARKEMHNHDGDCNLFATQKLE